MATAEPKVAVLMAVYRPRTDWLEEQLRSLDAQTWKNITLYVRDDCSPSESFEVLEALIRKSIRRFPYVLRRNEVNLGSNKTFERLTSEADGDYFAYCDQDDVWFPGKIEKCVRILQERKDALLVNTDMVIIDENGTPRAGSITKIRPHHRFRDGAGLAGELVFTNFVTGCTMMLRAETAKAAVPFCPYMVHDQYLALYCANLGEIATIMEPHLQYRIHSANQTREMAGVTDKASYLHLRIENVIARMDWLLAHLDCDESLQKEILQLREWYCARRSYMLHGKGAGTMWKYRHYSPFIVLFELLADHLPEWLFMLGIRIKRKNA